MFDIRYPMRQAEWPLPVAAIGYRLSAIGYRLSVIGRRTPSAKPLRYGLHFVHDPQQVAAPQLGNLRLGVAAADQFERDVERLVGAVPAVDAAAAVEVGRNADVIDADQLDRVVDVIDEVLDRRAAGGGDLRIGRFAFLLHSGPLLVPERCRRVPAAAAALAAARSTPRRISGRRRSRGRGSRRR